MRLLMIMMLPLMLLVPVLAADDSGEPVIESRYEKRFRDLAGVLRCLVCQNQTLLDSNAPLARDLRREIITMMKQGKSNQEIIDFLVNRYGDFVLYRPPVKPATYFLWGGPFLFLLVAVIVVIVFVRRRKVVTDADFTDDEQRRLHKLLDDDNGRGDNQG